jgi:hypothetical protein
LPFSRLALALPVLSLVLAGSGSLARAAPFDGTWSVLIITQKGDCDTAYRYELNVNGGKVSYAEGGGFTVSGNVGGSGSVNVSIRRGEQGASASGRLSGTTGAGKWSGKSATATCSGRWEAQKR